jgi:signal transduction histidine kinase
MQMLRTSTPHNRRRLLLIYVIAAAVMVTAFIPLWAETRFEGDFAPMGDALNWDRLAIALHLITDVLIGLAYVAISITLIVLARRAGKSIPFLWAFVAFGAFIVACGLTHFMAAVTLWEPIYWVAGGVKYMTALASVGTAIAIPPLVPRVVGIAKEAQLSHERKLQLEESNRELEAALNEAQRTRSVLQQTLSTQQDDLESLAREVELRRSQAADAMRAREEFFSIAAHELKTPLTTIKVSAQLLHRRTRERSPDQTVLSNRLLGQIERLEDLVVDLLDVSRIQHGRLDLRREPSDLAAIAREAVQQFDLHEQNGGRVSVDEAGPVHGSWDPGRIEQIITNLLSNALKYSPPGSPIIVGVRSDDGWAVMTVTDEGRGIPEDDLGQIFQPFARGGMIREISDGVGLGLYICRQIAELHGGTIAVASTVGEGTTFTVTLPLGEPGSESNTTAA